MIRPDPGLNSYTPHTEWVLSITTVVIYVDRTKTVNIFILWHDTKRQYVHILWNNYKIDYEENVFFIWQNLKMNMQLMEWNELGSVDDGVYNEQLKIDASSLLVVFSKIGETEKLSF